MAQSSSSRIKAMIATGPTVATGMIHSSGKLSVSGRVSAVALMFPACR